MFKEEVAAFFEEKNISYLSNVIMYGKAKAEHRFDFSLERKEQPQIILQTLSTETVTYAQRLARDITWAWMDVRNAGATFCGVALVNDDYPVWEGEPNATTLSLAQ
jgi:hypothetical protein